MNISITAKTYPASQDFLKIIEGGQAYPLDSFIKKHQSDAISPIYAVLENCQIKYRGEIKNYKDYLKEQLAFTKRLRFFEFNSFKTWPSKNDRYAVYFVKKANECLEIARFFTMKSARWFESNEGLNWNTGYMPHFLFRCIYFGTAVTWYANCYDHILQIVYWCLKFYMAAKDRDDQPYDPTWDDKKLISLCVFDLVVKELKASPSYKDVRKMLITCYEQIKEVRQWSNYTKHKGGLDYKYIEVEAPFRVFIQKDGGEKEQIKDFEPLIEIDIDAEMHKLAEAHENLFKCLSDVVTKMDFESRTLKFSKTEESIHG
jgi:hypothetical protein